MSSATLKSIARATGFSITTVSRALAGYDDVNAETRRIIVEEALRQGYSPNLHARVLQGQRAQTLGFVIPASEKHYSDPFFSQFVAGIGDQAAAEGFDLLLSTHDSVADEIDVYRRLIAGRRVDGFVLARARLKDARIDYLLTAMIPFVVFGRSGDLNQYVYIDTDGTTGQRLLTEHFIALGHRRIAYIHPPHDLAMTRFRLQGYYEAMTAHDLPIYDSLLVEAAMTEGGGREAALDLIALPTPPTAIMAGNDLMAFGIMSAVQTRGLRVGSDIAVGGFDDIPAAEYVHPGLTTVRQSIFQTAHLLTRLLLDLIRGQAPEVRGTLIAPELVIRGSSGQPRLH